MPVATRTGQVNYKLKPEKGEPGGLGPMVYPAGEYVVGGPETYTRTALSAPSIIFMGKFYVLNKEGTVDSSLNPMDDYAAHGNSATWVYMPKMKYLFAEVFFAAFAKLGSAIFNGDFTISQHGIDENGIDSTNYQNFGKKSADGRDLFTPNISIDWLNGILNTKKAIIGNESIFKGRYFSECIVIDNDTIDKYMIKYPGIIDCYVLRLEYTGYNIQFNAVRKNTAVLFDPMADERFLGCEFTILMTRSSAIVVAVRHSYDQQIELKRNDSLRLKLCRVPYKEIEPEKFETRLEWRIVSYYQAPQKA